MEPENPYANLGKEAEPEAEVIEEPSKQGPPSMINETGIPHNDKQLGMWCHLIPLLVVALGTAVGLSFLGFLGPLIIMNTGQPRSPFVIAHAKESLNVQISLLIYGAVTVAVGFMTCGLGLLLLIPLGIIYLVFGIIATVAANNGRDYLTPLCIRLIK